MPTTLALARQIATRVNMREIMIAPMADLAADLVQLAQTTAAEQKANVVNERMDLVAMYGLNNYTEKPFAFADGIAVIPIHGSLINRFSHSWGFITGYNFIQNQLRMALSDDDVKVIVFDCNSPGGEVTGLFETCDEIFLSRGQKPLIAMIDTACYSACYALASSCDRIIITPSGGAGSIGAMCLHVSVAEALKMDGVKVTPIYSGSHKIDGASYADLPEKVRLEIQTATDESRQSFVELVSRNLGIEEKVIFDTEAACYRSAEALALGLVHEIATPSQAVIKLINELNGSPDTEDDEMQLTDAQKAVLQAAGMPVGTTAAAPAAATAPVVEPVAAPVAAAPTLDASGIQKAERERCMAITGSEEGKANNTLAQHLAFNTQMSAEEAIGTLKAAGAAPAPVAAAPAAAAPAVDAFAQAMNNGSQPNVGADLGAADLGAKKDEVPGASLIASYALASGVTLN